MRLRLTTHITSTFDKRIMEDLEIAKAALSKLEGNVGLGITIASATIAGIIALLSKIYFELKPDAHPFGMLKNLRILLFAFIMAASSSLFGHLAQGSLAAIIPNLFNHNFVEGQSLTYADFEGHSTLRFLMHAQYFFLLISFGLTFSFLYKNIKIIGGNK